MQKFCRNHNHHWKTIEGDHSVCEKCGIESHQRAGLSPVAIGPHTYDKLKKAGKLEKRKYFIALSEKTSPTRREVFSDETIKINDKTDNAYYSYNKDIEEILQKTNRILTITEVIKDNGHGYYAKEMGSRYRWYDKEIKCLVEPETSEPETSEPSLNRWQILDIRCE